MYLLLITFNNSYLLSAFLFFLFLKVSFVNVYDDFLVIVNDYIAFQAIKKTAIS